MKTFRFFYLLLVIAFVGCTRHNDNTVVIHSISDTIFTEINIREIGYENRLEQTFKVGETCQFTTDVATACLFSASFRKNNDFPGENNGCFNKNDFYTDIFVTPGDVVTCKTIAREINGENHYEIIFEGKNAAHYNYNTEKRKVISREEEPDMSYNLNIDLIEYKQLLQAYRDREIEFLNNYKKEHSVSEDFINYALANINNWYAYKLYISAFFSKNSLPAGYLDDVTVMQNLLSIIALGAMEYKYAFCLPNFDVEQIYNAILDEVHPQFHSMLLRKLITQFTGKSDKTYQESLLRVMNQIEKTSTDSALLACVQEYKPFYLLSGTTLSDSILDNTYLRSFQSNQKITLRQMFDNYKNTAIYLDFWLSGYRRSRYFIQESAGNKPYFAEKQIAIVYISTDKDKNEWRKAATEDNITENQYLLLEHEISPIIRKNSPMRNYLKIKDVPRYVLFNKNHEIEMLNAPQLTGYFFDELKKIIERNPEKYITEKPATKK